MTISAQGAASIEAFAELTGPDNCRISGDRTRALLEPLMMAAASPEEDERGFWTATAILLADRLQGRQPKENFWWFWDSYADRYRAAPPPVRAALMNGFYHARQLSLVAEEICPKPEDRVTESSPLALLGPLKAIARNMTPAERKQVARADYGFDADNHFDALNAVLERQDCEFSADNIWCPLEVVELTSLGPDRPGHIPCTALIIIHALRDEDMCLHAELCWESAFQLYRSLPASIGAPILKGFRFLYETDDDWNPFKDWSTERLARQEVAIPWCDPINDSDAEDSIQQES